MAIKQLEQSIKKVETKIKSNQRIMVRYYRNTIQPFLKQLHPVEITGGIIVLTYLLRRQFKKFLLPLIWYAGKKELTSFLFLQVKSFARQQTNRR